MRATDAVEAGKGSQLRPDKGKKKIASKVATVARDANSVSKCTEVRSDGANDSGNGDEESRQRLINENYSTNDGTIVC